MAKVSKAEYSIHEDKDTNVQLRVNTYNVPSHNAVLGTG